MGRATFQDSQPTHAPWRDVLIDLSVSVPILDGSWACYGFWVERNTRLWIIIMSWKCSFTSRHISLNSNLLTLFGSLISWQYFVPFAATRAFFGNICFFFGGELDAKASMDSTGQLKLNDRCISRLQDFY